MQALWMLLAAFMFSLMVLCIKLAADSHTVGLGEIVFMRGAISALLLYLWARQTQVQVFPSRWTPHIIRNLAGCSAMWLSFYATTILPLSIATALNYTSPLFLALWTVLFTGMVLQRHHFLTIFLGFFGVLAILRPTIESGQWFAACLALISSILSTVAYLQIRTMGREGEKSWRIVLVFSIATTLSGAIAIPFQSNNILDFPLQLDVIGYLLGIGTSGLIAQLALTRALAHGSTLLASSLQYSTIIFSVVWGMLFWQENADIFKGVGIAMIIAGGVLSAWQASKKSA